MALLPGSAAVTVIVRASTCSWAARAASNSLPVRLAITVNKRDAEAVAGAAVMLAGGAVWLLGAMDALDPLDASGVMVEPPAAEAGGAGTVLSGAPVEEPAGGALVLPLGARGAVVLTESVGGETVVSATAVEKLDGTAESEAGSTDGAPVLGAALVAAAVDSVDTDVGAADGAEVVAASVVDAADGAEVVDTSVVGAADGANVVAVSVVDAADGAEVVAADGANVVDASVVDAADGAEVVDASVVDAADGAEVVAASAVDAAVGAMGEGFRVVVLGIVVGGVVVPPEY